MASFAQIGGGAAQGAASGFTLGGPWGAALGGVLGGILGAFQSTPHADPFNYTPTDVSRGQVDFLGQAQNLPGVSKIVQQANAIDNAAYQKQASEFAPNLMGNIKQEGQNTSSLLAGNLTPGVQAALGKPGATARDLGLTSDQLMRAGAAQLPGEVKTATGLNPFNITSTDTLLSPAALLQREDQKNMYNNQIQNQQDLLQFGAANSNNIPSSILSGIGSLAGNLRGAGFSSSGGSGGGLGYGFGQGDTGPTSDANFDATGNFIGGYSPFG